MSALTPHNDIIQLTPWHSPHRNLLLMNMKAKLGRNDPCRCGSGKKYKACCGRLAAGRETGGRGDRRAAEHAAEAGLGPLVQLMNAGRFAQLEGAARALLNSRPQSGLLWQLLGVALVKQGKDAMDALVKAAHYLPNDAVAHLNLGNEYGRRGLFEDAQESYGRALSIRPDFAEACNNLANLQLESGRDDEAVANCRRAIAVKPDFAEAHENLAKASARLGRMEEALANYRRALALKPGSAEAHCNLAGALCAIGMLDDAVAGYRRALLIKPDFVPAHTGLGTALRLQRRTVTAEASCRAALAIDPRSAAAVKVLAELRADDGRFTEAEEFYRQVLVIDPDSPDAWAGLTRLRRMTTGDAAWLAAAQRILRPGLPPPEEMQLRFAMGKYFDDVADYDNAFASYRRANELANKLGPRHDREHLSRTIDLIIRSHGKAWIDRQRQTANPSGRPVFIVGMLRSGTTLAEQILASHPEVFGAGELSFWGPSAAPAIAGAVRSRAREITMSDQTLAGLGSAYMELLQRLSAHAPRVVDKLPTNFLFLGLIKAALPNARIIHMRRNPADTCLSIYFQRFEAANTYVNDLADLAHYYREYRRLMQHWNTVLPAGAILEVPYEGLVEDLATWVVRMLDFIGLPFHPACLDFHRTARTVVTASKWQVRQKISPASVERWRHYEKYLGPLQSLLDSSDVRRSNP
jgi:tetratricopeptide (TPR) repeat protein